MKIKRITAREILDSRANPTVEVEIETMSGDCARASVPSGASTGENEALELRDNDLSRYAGRGTLKAVENVNSIIAPALTGYDVGEQAAIDAALISLDGTENKSVLGANAILAVSLAAAHAAARSYRMPLYRYIGGIGARTLPVPMMNIINGGAHSDAAIAFQEFMIRPIGARTFAEALQMGAEVFHSLKKVLREKGFSTAVGDEGGFAPALGNIEEALDAILTAVEDAGYRAGSDITLALDCAASEYYRDGIYDYSVFEGERGQQLTSQQQIDYLEQLVCRYPIDSIEDGMSENDISCRRMFLGHSPSLFARARSAVGPCGLCQQCRGLTDL